MGGGGGVPLLNGIAQSVCVGIDWKELIPSMVYGGDLNHQGSSTPKKRTLGTHLAQLVQRT